MTSSSSRERVDILLLGSGWTSQFVIPLFEEHSIKSAFTTRSSNPSLNSQSKCYSFKLPDEPLPDDDVESEQTVQEIQDACQVLPSAKMIVQVFPCKSRERVRNLVKAYHQSHPGQRVDWVQLGSTGAWPSVGASTSSSPVDTSNLRAQAEDELLSLHSPKETFSLSIKNGKAVVLSLAGLYGGERQPENFARRVAPSQEALEGKGSLHLIHGMDVARAILGVWKVRNTDREDLVWNRRWIVSDSNVYDWWQLFQTLKPFPDSSTWTSNLLEEHEIRQLPRPIASNPNETAPRYLVRALDGQEFWKAIEMEPIAGRCDSEERLKEAKGEAERKAKVESEKNQKEGKM